MKCNCSPSITCNKQCYFMSGNYTNIVNVSMCYPSFFYGVSTALKLIPFYVNEANQYTRSSLLSTVDIHICMFRYSSVILHVLIVTFLALDGTLCFDWNL